MSEADKQGIVEYHNNVRRNVTNPTAKDMRELVRLFVLIDFSLTVKAATLKFICGCGSAISSATGGKSGFIYNLVNS